MVSRILPNGWRLSTSFGSKQQATKSVKLGRKADKDIGFKDPFKYKIKELKFSDGLSMGRWGVYYKRK